MNEKKQPNELARSLREFFSDHMPRLRGMSPHTIHSYRDCLALLLSFVAGELRRPVVKLDVPDLNPDQVIKFLHYLEQDRGNSPSTRNVRLAAIHIFFQFLAQKQPHRLELCQRILAIPFKRARSRTVEYLEYSEIQSVLAAIDRSSKSGQRDYILIVTLFNTGARVQEILDLRVRDLQLNKPFQIRLFGKGRKERICPLWPQTAQLLSELLSDWGNLDPTAWVFLNQRGQQMSRFGVRYLLAKYCNLARETAPTLNGKRLHPHSMRHTTAVHLLKSGVDIATISQWLGHASINTTNRYATVDLDIKREAISKVTPIADTGSPLAPWRADATILTWLESL